MPDFFLAIGFLVFSMSAWLRWILAENAVAFRQQTPYAFQKTPPCFVQLRSAPRSQKAIYPLGKIWVLEPANVPIGKSVGSERFALIRIV